MSLKEKLDEIKAGAAKRVPEDMFATMGQATQDLRASGIMDGVIKPGTKLPAFSLENAAGAQIDSSGLFTQGAVVLTIFRGSW